MTALLLSGLAIAGPWVKDAGSWYAKGAYGQFRGDSYVDATGELIDDVSYLGQSVVLYGEVGVGAGLQLVASVPWQLARQVDASGRSYRRAGLGDLDLGVGRALAEALPLSAHVVAKLPAYGGVDGDRFGTEAVHLPALGDGQVDLAAELAVGGGGAVGQVRWWTEGALAYVHRTPWALAHGFTPAADFGDGLDYGGKVGLLPGFGWLALGLSGRHSFDDDGSTKAWRQLDGSAAVEVAEGLAVEFSGAWVYAAVASSTGASGFVGLSHRR